MTGRPVITVVTATHDRAHELPELVAAVLAQKGAPPFELIVVDDGSTDDTADVAADLAGPHVRVLRQANRGPAAARNTGAASAQGDWLVFLDDDDRPDPDWLASLAAGFAADVAVVSCGYRNGDGTGRRFSTVEPTAGRLFGGASVTEATGAVAMRRTCFVDAGGYLDGLALSENTDLIIRLTSVARSSALRVVTVPGAPLQVRWRPVAERTSLNPANSFAGARWLRVRYPLGFAANRPDDLNYLRIACVGAARLGRWADARRCAASSVARSRSASDVLRLIAAAVPPVGRRVWSRDGARRLPPRPADSAITATWYESFLPWGYAEGDPDDDRSTGRWDAGAVHRWAVRHGAADRSLVRVGELSRSEDPVALISELRRDLTANGGIATVAEPDRDSLDEPVLGPPADPTARRHWSGDGLALLAESAGFSIVGRASVPASSRRLLDRVLRRGPRWIVLRIEVAAEGADEPAPLPPTDR